MKNELTSAPAGCEKCNQIIDRQDVVHCVRTCKNCGHNPPPLIRKNSERKPMMDLDAMDQAAELEHARKAQIEEEERSRAEHQARLAEAASAPAPGKAKPPAKRKKEVA
jgi:hypothetical protein